MSDYDGLARLLPLEKSFTCEVCEFTSGVWGFTSEVREFTSEVGLFTSGKPRNTSQVQFAYQKSLQKKVIFSTS